MINRAQANAGCNAAPSPLLLMPDKARRFLEKRPSYGSYGADGHGGEQHRDAAASPGRRVGTGAQEWPELRVHHLVRQSHAPKHWPAPRRT